MALDNPVFPFGPRRLWRSSRVIELTIVVGLTVAVVAVAALWGGSSTAPDSEGVTSVETPAVVPTTTAPEAATPLPGEQHAPASVDSVEAEATSVASAVGTTAPEAMVPTQTGIVPGRPDPLDPATPHSFERYQVQRGESLFSIASARGVSVAELARWNWHLREDSVLIRGEWIWIPAWDLPIVAGDSGSTTEDGKSGRGGG